MDHPHLLQVFTDAQGMYGDAASIVIDEDRHIGDDERQAMAGKLNTGETIFINDIANVKISVMHPRGEIDFAGVGVLATAWLLTKLRGKTTEHIEGRGGMITTWQDGDITWVRASLTTMPAWQYKQLDTAKAVELIKLQETTALQHTMVWAWIDQSKGTIRARTFASDWDIPEAQGNGSGAMVLAATLGRPIEIIHGEGSVIFARPAEGNCADIGGRVKELLSQK